MKQSFKQILVLAVAAGAAQAIEPPVDSQPVPPQAPPVALPQAPTGIHRVDAEPPVARPVPMAGEGAEVVAGRPCLGVILGKVPELLSLHLKLAPGEGMLVDEVVAGGPAERAGLAASDLITKVDGTPVGTPEEVRSVVTAHQVGDAIALEVVQAGERKEVEVVLSDADELMDRGLAMGPDASLRGMLEDLPDRQARMIREALERNRRQFEDLEQQAALPRDILRRIERSRRFGGEGIDLDGFTAESTIRLMDEEGTIELKSRDGVKQARVFDQAGELLWEGPFDTEEDKAAVPADIRERLDRLNIDLDFQGNGIRLRPMLERFRPLDQLDPEAPGEETLSEEAPIEEAPIEE